MTENPNLLVITSADRVDKSANVVCGNVGQLVRSSVLAVSLVIGAISAMGCKTNLPESNLTHYAKIDASGAETERPKSFNSEEIEVRKKMLDILYLKQSIDSDVLSLDIAVSTVGPRLDSEIAALSKIIFIDAEQMERDCLNLMPLVTNENDKSFLQDHIDFAGFVRAGL